MSLPAFSAIIANYVPNHGNIGPSGSYNAWVNKINTRKNACNSWATCTNTPDDIWDEKFIECDEGCSAQGDDKCVSNFCDALADVYDYTRRLEAAVIKTEPSSLTRDMNGWITRHRWDYRDGGMDSTLLSAAWGECEDGCISNAGEKCALTEQDTVAGKNAKNFCMAMEAMVADPNETPKNMLLAYSRGDEGLSSAQRAYFAGDDVTCMQAFGARKCSPQFWDSTIKLNVLKEQRPYIRLPGEEAKENPDYTPTTLL